MSGFIYIWYDTKRKKYYIGSHWGTLDDGYICSSIYMRRAFKRRPNDFKRKILEHVITNRNDLYEREDQWLNLIKDKELGTRYYNLSKVARGNRGTLRKKWTLEQRAAHSARLKGRKFSEEHKQKIRKALKGKPKTLEHTTKMKASLSIKMRGDGNHFFGKTHTPETIQKIKEARSRQIISQETRKKMSESHRKNVTSNM